MPVCVCVGIAAPCGSSGFPQPAPVAARYDAAPAAARLYRRRRIEPCSGGRWDGLRACIEDYPVASSRPGRPGTADARNQWAQADPQGGTRIWWP